MTRSIEELKEEISLEEVLIECGARFQNGGWRQNEVPFFCFAHPNYNTPAASMNPLKGVWNCYSCGAGGSIIDAAMLHVGTTSVQKACEWLESEFLL